MCLFGIILLLILLSIFTFSLICCLVLRFIASIGIISIGFMFSSSLCRIVTPLFYVLITHGRQLSIFIPNQLIYGSIA